MEPLRCRLFSLSTNQTWRGLDLLGASNCPPLMGERCLRVVLNRPTGYFSSNFSPPELSPEGGRGGISLRLNSAGCVLTSLLGSSSSSCSTVRWRRLLFWLANCLRVLTTLLRKSPCLDESGGSLSGWQAGAVVLKEWPLRYMMGVGGLQGGKAGEFCCSSCSL